MVGLICFFIGCCSFDSIPELRIKFWSGQPFYFGAPGNVNTFFNNSSAGYIISSFRRSCTIV